MVMEKQSVFFPIDVDTRTCKLGEYRLGRESILVHE
jgi:hypothetical protein